MSPSRRSSQGGSSGRGRGRDDGQDERGGRGGRGGRRRSGGGSFGSILLVGIVLFFVISGVALFVYHHNLNTAIADDQGMRDSYNGWIKQCQDGLQIRAASIAEKLKPIYADVPKERQTPEFIAKLCEQYTPALRDTGADYAWCKKSWTVGSDPMSANISPGNAQKFLPIPTRCVPLDDGKTIPLPNLNGSLAQSGVISLFYDMDESRPVAVLQLNLADTAEAKPAEPGAKPPKPTPPTMFVLWYTMPAPSSSGQAYLNKMIKNAN